MIRVRPGVVLTHVCGRNILVAAIEARQYCPYTTLLNDTGEVIWNCLSKGMDLPEISVRIREEFDIPPETDVEEIVSEYFNQLHENGYVLFEGE